MTQRREYEQRSNEASATPEPDHRGSVEIRRLGNTLKERLGLSDFDLEVKVIPRLVDAYAKGVEIGGEYARREPNSDKTTSEEIRAAALQEAEDAIKAIRFTNGIMGIGADYAANVINGLRSAPARDPDYAMVWLVNVARSDGGYDPQVRAAFSTERAAKTYAERQTEKGDWYVEPMRVDELDPDPDPDPDPASRA